ncbi:MAG: hypothetical protein HDS68_08465 [Bacteroidales bacterium]|nr:hypothetical protein [Bacteroidales bacterium]
MEEKGTACVCPTMGNGGAIDFIAEIEKENRRRNERAGKEEKAYDPLTGAGGFGYGDRDRRRRRRRVRHQELTLGRYEYIPAEMYGSEEYKGVKSREEWVRLRCRHDFEFWAATCVRIKDKRSSKLVPFRLNRPQRRVLSMMEDKRLDMEPIRMIMLKARQWGGSTLVQMYMAWIQCTRMRHWHSLICAHVARASATIRGMYSTMLANYPVELWEGDTAPKLNRFEGQDLIKEIAGRECRVTIGSSERQDSIRGADYAMAHLSEVAFWKDTPKSTPVDFVRAICGAIATEPDTLIVYESTANGMGNFFHSEWKRSEQGQSDKMAVFVPWHEIEMYSRPVKDVSKLWHSMDAYERQLWEQGATLESINWYHAKRREYADHQAMMAEYPSTPHEAFANTGTNVFSTEAVDRMSRGCCDPRWRGEVTGEAPTGARALRNVRFAPDTTGRLTLWEKPAAGCRYVAAVDVGGRSVSADWSVIAVLTVERCPRVVAQWRGHIDHDLLTWKAAAIARYYNSAMLVFESNTLETEAADQGQYILHELCEHYSNLYMRMSPDGNGRPRPGFHTNRATKQMIITELIGAVRDGTYEEHDMEACHELSVYEQMENGSYGARRGYHDDILMTRAIALHAIREQFPETRLSPDEDDPYDDLLAFYRH